MTHSMTHLVVTVKYVKEFAYSIVVEPIHEDFIPVQIWVAVLFELT